METIMSVTIAATAVVAGVVFVAVGLFSVVSLLWDDLLESDPPQAPPLRPAA